MSTDKTLADVQPGGRVRLGDQPPFIFARFVNGVRMAEGVTIEKERNLTDAMQVAAKVASKGPNGEIPVLVHVAALSARPSPGGQNVLFIEELAELQRLVPSVNQKQALDAAIAALAARQPVGEPVDFYVCDACGHYYMDDGVTCDCTPDAVQPPLRHVRMVAAPPAQAVDLGQFRPAVELMEWQERGHANPDFPVGDPKKHAEALRLLALIDSQAVGK
ncbi:hypothetical protein [uncultured Stenotrophomonas sp.]|uniref:hypothetical protein n=1 Tax=uncultured Stenotrophomonas sp. TaxID=165438 RepID=UPI0025838068|nr:hypothetical protein [uncultured Stenotrophomonas sp.]